MKEGRGQRNNGNGIRDQTPYRARGNRRGIQVEIKNTKRNVGETKRIKEDLEKGKMEKEIRERS